MSDIMDPSKLKVAELRAELQARGLDSKGNKPVLVDRLRAALEEEAACEEGDDVAGGEEEEEAEGEEELQEEEAEAPEVEEEHDVSTAAKEPEPPQQEPEVAKKKPESPVKKTASPQKAAEPSPKKPEPEPSKKAPEPQSEVKAEPEDSAKLGYEDAPMEELADKSDAGNGMDMNVKEEELEIKEEAVEVKQEVSETEESGGTSRRGEKRALSRSRSPEPAPDAKKQRPEVEEVRIEDEPEVDKTVVALDWYHQLVRHGALFLSFLSPVRPHTADMDSFTFYGSRQTFQQRTRQSAHDNDGTTTDSDSDDEIPDYGSDYMPDEEELLDTENLIDFLPESVAGSSTSLHEPTPGTSHTCQGRKKVSAKKKRQEVPLWRVVNDANTALDTPEWLGNIEPATTISHPTEYFRMFFSPDLMQHIVDQSNLYAAQQDINKNLNLSIPELEQFLGSILAMSLVKLSNSRLYWKARLQCPMVSEVMSRDRWEEIKANLHFNNNDEDLPKNDPNHDKLFKVRPLITHLAEKFREIPKPQRLCVDEQIIPFKGTSSLKQYIPSKPHKWGYKVFSLCGVDGIMYDFEVYTGKIEPLNGKPDLRPSSNMVLHLSKSIPEGINHLLYFDNWFTSLPLMAYLANQKIHCLGTVRTNRLPGISFASDKDLLKKGRGALQEKSALIDDVEVRAVKWMDNRSVHLLSTFASAQPMNECKRYDKKAKNISMIPCPAIVKEYNEFMGGVDLMDCLIALYRIHTRSKKFYHKIFFHFLDVAVVNSWLLYRRHCRDLGTPSPKIMILQEFKLNLAESLLLEGKSLLSRKRGRPSSNGSVAAEFQKKKRESPATKAIPSDGIRTDGYHHYPVVMARGRCKNPKCKAIPVFYCNKCEVHLCITKERNCFIEFHTK